MLDYIETKHLEEIIRQSNWIEGERTGDVGQLYGKDMEIGGRFVELAKFKKSITKEFIEEAHTLLTDTHGKNILPGYRRCNVRVGSFLPPTWQEVPKLMHQYLLDLSSLSSWEAHIRYERIHPHEDLNGRMGRLVWLYKEVEKRGSVPGLTFLHSFYYDTLKNVSL